MRIQGNYNTGTVETMFIKIITLTNLYERAPYGYIYPA